MRKIFLLSFFYVVFIGVSPILPNTFYATKTNAVYSVPNSGPSLYYTGSGSSSSVDVGLQYISQNYNTSRTQYDFNLSSIPTNATISSVSLTYQGTNYNNAQFHYNITQLSGNISNPQDLWQGIGNSTALFQNILYSASGSFSNSTLVSLINNNKAGHLYLGAISQNEGNVDSYATVYLQLDVQFTVPSQNISLCADNNFNISPWNNGQIIVDGGQQTAPFNFTKASGQTATLTAVSNQTDGQLYQRIWSTAAPLVNSNWTAKNSSGNFNLPGTRTNVSYTTVSLTNSYNGVTFTANLLKVCNIPVQNNMVGLVNAGTIIVNGIQYSSGTVIPVVEQNPITVTAQNQTINGIDYTFTNWSDDISNHQNPRTFYPTDNTAISAVFVGTPNVNSMNVSYDSETSGTCPTIYWTDNANTYVSYNIYRSVMNVGIWSPWCLIGNVPKGVHQYADGDYKTIGKTINYQLRLDACYSTENTSTTAHYCYFAANEWNMEKKNFGNSKSTEIAEYKLYDNFPNPFNPSTEIYYQLPNDGNVKLKVYNLMGQEVMTLVNGFKEKGMYSVSFNAGNLASGLYIYKLEAGNYTQVKKMILTK